MENNIRSTDTKLKTSLRLVTLAATMGLPFFTITGGPALTGFLRDMGANDFIYSLIMAMPVFGAVIQVFASYVMENTGKRKAFFLIAGFIHRPLWIPIALMPFIFPSARSSTGILAVMVLIGISMVANAIVGMSFNSWMGSLVPAEIKGRFFSRRLMIVTIASGIAALASGLMLDVFPGFPGFTAVFIIAALFGAADIATFFWIKHPPMNKPERKIPFVHLMKETWHDKNYVRFIMFVAFWYFGVNFAGPFFSVFMIEELHMNFLLISLFTQVAGSVATIFSIRIWGRLADKYGSKPVMFICCSVIFAMPLVWLFTTPKTTWIILAINILGGIFWPGFDMNAGNQSIWLAPEKNRSTYIANYALVVSLIGTGAAFVLGGIFMEVTGKLFSGLDIPFIMGQRLSNYHVLFFISFLVRALVLLFLFRSFKEVNSQKASVMLADLKNNVKGRLRIL